MVVVRNLVALLLICGVASASDGTKINLNGDNKVNERDMFISRNVVMIDTEIADFSVNPTMDIMQNMIDDGAKDLYLVLNSGGGSIVAGLRLINFIKTNKKVRGVRTTCIVEELSASMAAVISAYCHKSYIHKYASFMHHLPGYSVQGQRDILNARHEGAEDWLDEVEEDLAVQYGLTVAEWKELIGTERWFSPRKAVRYGFFDGIINLLDHKGIAPEPPKNVFSIFGIEVKEKYEY